MRSLDSANSSLGSADSPVIQPLVSDTLRQTVTVLSRQRRTVAIVFAAIMVGALLAGLVAPKEYEAEMKILVLHDRTQPSISAGISSVTQAPEISEEEINSEVELIRSKDILQDVVLRCGLDKQRGSGRHTSIANIFGWKPRGLQGEDDRIAQAVVALGRDLKVRSMTKTNMIDVTYKSTDPRLSVKVLNVLASLYIKKHLEVHQIPGALRFFTFETQHYQNQLAGATSRLAAFTKQYGIGSASDERDQDISKLVDFEASMRQAEADVSDKMRRISMIKGELQTTPERMETQVRLSDNPALLEKMQSSLLEKELKQSELAATFNSNYQPLRELNAEIAQVRSAIEAQKQTPVKERTSDATPTHTYLLQELAKSQADLASAGAQASALAAVVRDYRARVSALEQRTIQEQALDRDVKMDEANYLLYRNKLEESRISDALDDKNIANVAIAEAPSQPSRPSSLGLLMFLSIGLVIATVTSAGSAFLVDSLALTFRTSEEVEKLLGVPVLLLLQDGTRGNL